MKYGLCLEMVYTKLPLEERMRKAADVGFKYGEMWFVDMTWKGKPESLAAIARQAGIMLTNTVIGAPDGSIGGGLTNPANREQWLERTKMTLAFNKAAGIPATIVCTGNEVAGLSREQMLASILDGLKTTVDLADKSGINLLLEPLNLPYDHAGYFLAGSDLGADICRRVNSPRLKMLYDCYHMQIMEGDMINHIKKNLGMIGHFHSAGVPGRHELFNGETNYPFVISEIEKMGYQGVFGLEYSPSMEDTASLKKTLAYLTGK
jgi:hydroxypyruvate isomerase